MYFPSLHPVVNLRSPHPPTWREKAKQQESPKHSNAAPKSQTPPPQDFAKGSTDPAEQSGTFADMSADLSASQGRDISELLDAIDDAKEKQQG